MYNWENFRFQNAGRLVVSATYTVLFISTFFVRHIVQFCVIHRLRITRLPYVKSSYIICALAYFTRKFEKFRSTQKKQVVFTLLGHYNIPNRNSNRFIIFQYTSNIDFNYKTYMIMYIIIIRGGLAIFGKIN